MAKQPVSRAAANAAAFFIAEPTMPSTCSAVPAVVAKIDDAFAAPFALRRHSFVPRFPAGLDVVAITAVVTSDAAQARPTRSRF